MYKSYLKDMSFYHVPAEGYVPTYTRTDFIDALHEAFGFRTDYEIVNTKQMKKILKTPKIKKHYAVFKNIESPEMPCLQGLSEFFCLTSVKDGNVTYSKAIYK